MNNINTNTNTTSTNNNDNNRTEKLNDTLENNSPLKKESLSFKRKRSTKITSPPGI